MRLHRIHLIYKMRRRLKLNVGRNIVVVMFIGNLLCPLPRKHTHMLFAVWRSHNEIRFFHMGLIESKPA